ncbi:MAG: MATE family efflux transporter [Bacillota bacterium]
MKNVNLLEGNIFKGLTKLALPIMGTSFLQMAYNLVDLFWLGRLSPNAVAAAGTAGFFMWFGYGILLLSKIGAEVYVAQNIGAGDHKEARHIAETALQLVISLGIMYALILYFYNKYMIGFFDIQDKVVVQMGRDYLKIIAIGIPFAFLNPVFTAIYNGYGDSKTPFKVNAIALVINIILDPILIFQFGLGIKGAALATSLAQLVGVIIFVKFLLIDRDIFNELNILKKIKFKKIKKIILIGLPVSIKSGLFTFIAMIITRLIADWGPIPIAVQKVGSQIESLSWRTSEGFATATSTFMAQNLGAKKLQRVKEVFKKAIFLMFIVGSFASIIFVVFPKEIMSIFFQQENVLKEGAIYLRILGFSQVFMAIEITTGGAFKGLSKTSYPSFISILGNAIRIPMAYYLSSASILGLSGIWWSISISSMIKGTVSLSIFLFLIYKKNILKNDI